MDRFTINCMITGDMTEIQFDLKKMPGETGPCYMVSIDGMFRGYIKKENSGTFQQLVNTHFAAEDMAAINDKLRLMKHVLPK